MKALVMLLAVLVAGCSSAPEVTVVSEADFNAMTPFKGKVVLIEKLEWPPDFRPTSVSAGHYRIRIQKHDGSVVEVERIETTIGSHKRLTDTLTHARGTYPTDIYERTEQATERASQPQRTRDAASRSDGRDEE